LRNIKYYYLVLILSVFFTSCEKTDNTVIDPTITFPSITAAFVTPNSFDTTFINPVIIAYVHSQEAISLVNAKISNPNGVLLADVELKDDGVAPDSAAGDGKYTGKLSYTLSCKLVGSYKVEFTAKNISGVYGNTLIVNFGVTNLHNNRPLLTTVISPDSLRRPSGTGSDSVNTAFLQAQPTDPDGICDINQVYFHSFKPDGTPSNSGNPIPMFDDMNIELHGDTLIDGKYSLIIKIVNNPNNPFNVVPQLGNYKFNYNAEDIGHLVSDTLTKFIYVHP